MAVGALDFIAPESIYLQVDVDGDPEDRSEKFPNFPDYEVTWCTDSQGGQEIRYVRSDIAAAEIDRLRGVLAECRGTLSDSAKVHRLFKNPGRADVIEDFITKLNAALAEGNGQEGTV